MDWCLLMSAPTSRCSCGSGMWRSGMTLAALWKSRFGAAMRRSLVMPCRRCALVQPISAHRCSA